MGFLTGFQPLFLSLLRVMAGLLLLQHGTTKLLNFPIGPQNNAVLQSMGGAAGMIELVAGLLLVIGLFTRPAAFVASGLTAVAYFLVHAGQNFFPILNKGELAVLYCFVFLYLSAAGGGPFSVDALVRQKE
jgi:putative oxidoreductase